MMMMMMSAEADGRRARVYRYEQKTVSHRHL